MPQQLLLINESSYLLKIIKKQVYFEKNIRTLSTKGFLYNYNNNENYPIDKNLIKYIKKYDNKKFLICIATDMDEAGEFIAYEIIKLFTQAKIVRLRIPFEKLPLITKNITIDKIISLSTTSLNMSKIKNFVLSDKIQINKEKIEALNLLYKLDMSQNKKIQLKIN